MDTTNVIREVPALGGHPIFGSLFEMRDNRAKFLLRVAREKGDAARVRMGIFNLLVLSAPDLAHEVFVEKNDAFVKGYGLSVFARPLLGNGLLTSEGEQHKKQRRLVAPAFVHKRIAEYGDVISRYTDQSLGRFTDGVEVDLANEMMRLTLSIVGKTLFDADVTGDAPEVGEVLTFAMEHLIDSVTSVVPLPPSVPTPGNLRAKKQIKRLDDIIYRIIRERRSSDKDAGDFLSMLLAAKDEDGSGMSDVQIRDEAMTIFLAGHETTANALAWTFYLLGKHPSVREELEAELDAALGGRRPALADLPKLPFTMAVFKEAMRLYPPAFMVARRATHDVTIGGIDVRKNQIIVVNILGMHHRAKFFERPEEFSPERFLPENEKNLERGAYAPFGGGPRVCIGNQFALMEGQMVLAHLAQHLRFELVDTEVDVEPLVTLRPKGGLHVRPRRRARLSSGAEVNSPAPS